MRAGAGLRVLRAAAFAAACVALAAAGHLAAPGPGLPPWTLVAGWAGVFAVAAALAGRERTLATIVPALALGQLALHVLFTLGQHGGGHAAHGHGPAAHGGGPESGALALAARLLCDGHAAALTEAEARGVVRDAGLPLPPDGAGGAGAAAGPGGAGGGPLAEAVASLASGPMLLGHLLAALAAGWLLRRGEAALWRLIRLSGRLTAEAVLPWLRAVGRALRLAAAQRRAPLPARPGAVCPARARRYPAPLALVAVPVDTVGRRGPPDAASLPRLAA